MKRNLAQLYDPRKYFHFECPKCGSQVDYVDVRIGFRQRWETDYWECTACKSLLCVSRIYAWSVALGTLAVALIVTWGLTIHIWYLFILIAVAAWLVVLGLAAAYIKWIFPPKVRLFIPDDISLSARR